MVSWWRKCFATKCNNITIKVTSKRNSKKTY
ncbi:MAG: hypothetical protein JRE92_06220, partial [Deltaproteobacteria bacterium]|nr:hypothetical protein [Deltaproteobacteria bacterium]